ncbi:molybdenum cofactor biosynthesis protein B [Alkalicoccobacillus murimartini]|uniref:Molybdenum cofactor biosynthesis protein B n=2 Tax=Alkalicoccobacillus murimartini TaxID=171685 RepID=A0ABT9YMD0_9BACI|nr:molybdenum cofactor biosynthesis protein B [Alkalicoccobacillus murimartini]
MTAHTSTRSVACKIITVSDTRTKETDKSGAAISTLLLQSGHVVVSHDIVKDDKTSIQSAIEEGLTSPSVEAILLNGGTGVSKRDVTYEVVEKLLEKQLPGFGELFRYISYQYDIGSAAMLSRAIAGTVEGKAVFSMPGSTGAVTLAMEKLILLQLSHIIQELNK